MKWEHGGEVYAAARIVKRSPYEILDFSSNLSPLPPPERLYELLRDRLKEVEFLPETFSESFKSELSKHYGIEEEAFFPSNGTTEWIYWLPFALKPRRGVIVVPTYRDYEKALRRAGVPTEKVELERGEEEFTLNLERLYETVREGDLVFLCNPNNPTGNHLDEEELTLLISERPEATFVVDESYLPFVKKKEEGLLRGELSENLVVLFSFSKVYKVPGLRLGMAVCGRGVRKRLEEWKTSWTVNRLAQVAGAFLISCTEHEKRVRETVKVERELLRNGLRRLGLKPYASKTNFLLVELPEGASSLTLQRLLLEKRGILVRACYNFEELGDRFVRISVRRREENEVLIRVLEELLKEVS